MMYDRENVITIGFSYEDGLGNKYEAKSNFEVFINLGENVLEELGKKFNVFLSQISYIRENEYIFMEDITGEEYEALGRYLAEFREQKALQNKE